MAVYRGKYELQGLGSISPEMEKNLDIAYELCASLKGELPCEMCGKCCHQPNIIIRPEEVDRVATAAGVDLYTFMTRYVFQTSDGRILINKTDDEACPFLGKDKRCTIWKNRPQICDDFPYMVSMLMSRIYLAITNADADILELIDYMDESWPCTKEIKKRAVELVEEGRKKRASAN